MSGTGAESILFSRFWKQEFAAGGGPFTALISQRIGSVVAYFAQTVHLTPNKITAIGLGISLLASTAFALLPIGLGPALLCLLLYQFAYGLDCADGQLARATAQTSEFGAWWDVVADIVGLLFMAFAVLYWLIASTESDHWLLFSGPFALAAGRVLALYSSKFTSSQQRDNKPGANAGSLKKVLWFLIDTPTLLLLLCVLRDVPFVLLGYLLAMGSAYCLNAAYLGAGRLYGSDKVKHQAF